MYVVGAHRDGDGWLAVSLARGRFRGASRFARFEELLATLSEATALVVDLPLRLSPDRPRLCDRLLHELVDPERVLEGPPLPALEAVDFDAADALTRTLTNRPLSKDVWAQREAILEVNAIARAMDAQQAAVDERPLSDKPRRHLARVMAERPETRESLRRYARIIEPTGRTGKRSDPSPPTAGRLVQGHPDLSERQLARDLDGPRESLAQRQQLLTRVGIDLPQDVTLIDADDAERLLAASALAWTAHRYAVSAARSVPPRELWETLDGHPACLWV